MAVNTHYRLLSSRRLDLMKATSYIVNTSRGEVIDENALARKLAGGQIQQPMVIAAERRVIERSVGDDESPMAPLVGDLYLVTGA